MRLVGTMRRRRSTLSVPAVQPRFLEKAVGVPCDEVMIDLEDSVPPDRKAQARGLAVAALTTHRYPAQIRAVRVNPLRSPFGEGDVQDLMQGAGGLIDCLVMSKVESAEAVLAMDSLLGELEANLGLERRTGLELQIESALGLSRLNEIAAASSRTEALILGPIDLAADLGMPGVTPGEPGDPVLDAAWVHYLATLLVAGRAHGLQAIDGPYPKLGDEASLERVTARSASLGFDGKWAINPSQVPQINRAFTPSEEQVARAREILSQFAAAQSQGQAAARSGGEMIDEASRRLAERIVLRAAATQAGGRGVA